MKPQAAYECNGALIAPEAFYAIACDPRRSVAVEACAGAGKTWMLVSRMVRAYWKTQTKPALVSQFSPRKFWPSLSPSALPEKCASVFMNG